MREPSTNTQVNLKEKKLQQNLITKVIYYITKKLQINLILKVSSPERELIREDQKFLLSHLEAVQYHIYLYLTGIVIEIKCLICGSKGTNRISLK